MANRPAPALTSADGDREELARWTRSTTVRAGLVTRARLVLAAAEGEANEQIAQRLGASKVTVLKWRARYARHGLAGLEDQALSGRPRIVDHCQLAATSLTPPPMKYRVTRTSTRLLARQLGVGDATIARGLARVPGPAVALRDVRRRQAVHRPGAGGQGPRCRRAVPEPPENAIVPCVDEKSQIQALDLTAPRCCGCSPACPSGTPTTISGTARPRCSRHWNRRRQGHRGVQAAAPPPRVLGVPQAGSGPAQDQD